MLLNFDSAFHEILIWNSFKIIILTKKNQIEIDWCSKIITIVETNRLVTKNLIKILSNLGYK